MALRKASVDGGCQTLDTDDLVKEYMPLVRQVARRYSRIYPEAFDDLLQVGCVGLLKAARSYDPTREGKASFKTFALCFIKGEIRHHLRDHSSLVQVPRRLNEINVKLSQIEEALMHELDRTPTVEELSERSGFSVADVREAQQSRDFCSRIESLDVSEDSDRGDDARVLSEQVADRRHIDAQMREEERELVMQALRNVGERTRQIIEFVYFCDLTQKEAAQVLGLSEMGVSRTLKRALGKLKDILFTEIF